MEKRDERIDVANVTLIWGDAVHGKAALRAESLEQHLARPLAVRLAAALALVRPTGAGPARPGALPRANSP